ncbi:MAG: fatty acid desaturase [Thermosynechococcaceae cyanobacterium]
MTISSSIPPSASLDESPTSPRQILASHDLALLNQRSDLAGALRLMVHLTTICGCGYLWTTAPKGVALLALVVCGISLAFMFCPMHECAHGTAFKRRWINDTVAWVAGFLSFYNSTFYWRYHKWHHRYTRQVGKDPELGDPEPKNIGQYLWQLSSLPWWRGKITGHLQVAAGQLDYAFLPESAHAEVIRSTRLQLGAYVAIALLSTLFGHPLFLVKYWLLPLAVGQPFLRFILLAEHTGCSSDDNPLTNTRTTLTLWPLRFLMWNMPYHTEHHLYPSIPFHALPAAHQQLKAHFAHIDSGYVRVNRNLLGAFE